METELNALLFPRLRKRLEGGMLKDQEVRVDGRVLDLGGRVQHQSLGAILHLLENEAVVHRALGGGVFRAEHAGWLRSNAPRELRGIVDLRNPAAHSEAVSRKRVEKVRAQVMGVGYEGALVRIARAKGAGE